MTRYFVDHETVGESGIGRVLAALLDLRRDDLVRAEIDVVTCGRDVPERARPAVDRLRDIAYAEHERRRRRSLCARLASRFRDPLMAVPLDLRVDENRELIRSFAPLSIAASLYSEDEREPLLTIDDCGSVIVFNGNDDLAAQVEARAGIAPGAVRELN